LHEQQKSRKQSQNGAYQLFSPVSGQQFCIAQQLRTADTGGQEISTWYAWFPVLVSVGMHFFIQGPYILYRECREMQNAEGLFERDHGAINRMSLQIYY
jgi:hypothetical protein